jgi:hypothetical protein
MGLLCPYLVDMLLYPLQRFPLIQKSNVMVSVFLKGITRQESESSNSVVEVDQDYIST